MELPVITILDFAKLAYYVYHDELIINKYFPNFIHRPVIPGDHFHPHKIPDGFYEVMLCPLTQSQAAQGHPFYASFFVKVMDRKAVGAVIAIRGTVATCLDNIRVDVDCWWKQLFNQDAHVQVPKSYLGAASKHSMMNLYHSLQEDVMAKGINATASCDFGFLECVLSQADKQFSPSHSKSCAPFRTTK